MTKRTSNCTSKSNSKLRVYYYLKQGLKTKQICTKCNIKYSTLSYHLKALKQDGYIKKVGYSTWITTEKELRFVPRGGRTNSKLFQDTIRGHAYQFTLKIPLIKNWKRRTEFLKKNKVNFELVGFGKTIPSIRISHYRISYKIWLCKESIVVYFPKSASFFKKSAEAAKEEAVYRFLGVISKLESILTTSFKIKKQYQFKIFNQHYALINNEIARHYHKENKVFQLKGKDDKVWLLVDNSHNLHEFEVIGKKAVRDTDVVIAPFMNTLREKPDILHELTREIDSLKVEDATRIRDVFEGMNNHSVTIEALKDKILALENKIR